jgi:hypothetical protein
MSGFLENQRISLIAPAGPCKTETVLSGKAVLEAYGGTVRIMPHVFDGGSLAHLSAADEARAADINDAVSSGDQLIWAVRGGCGCLRMLSAGAEAETEARFIQCDVGNYEAHERDKHKPVELKFAYADDKQPLGVGIGNVRGDVVSA